MHEMKLQDKPFNSILFGNKDIEMRLYDEKRQKINIGDEIEFTNILTGETFKVEVVNLHKFNNFKELYNSFDKERLGYNNEQKANYNDMEKYYSKEEIAKYGVVGIQIKVIK